MTSEIAKMLKMTLWRYVISTSWCKCAHAFADVVK